MDLSKLSDADLQALQAGDLTKVSDDGLNLLQGQSAQKPADTSGVINKIRGVFGKEPIDWNAVSQKQQDIDSGKIAGPAPIGDDLGMASFVTPIEAAPEAVSKLATFLGKNAPLRVATSAAVGAGRGALSNPDDRMSGALSGAGKGLAIGLGAEGVGAVANGIGQSINTVRTALDPSGTQEAAQEAIDATSDALKSSEAQNLQNQLGDKTLDINPRQYSGVDPEVDRIINGQVKAQRPYGDVAGTVTFPAQDVNQMRVKLDQASRNMSGNGVVDEGIAAKASDLRQRLHGLSPDVDQTYQDWSSNLQDAKKFDKASSPISFLGSDAGDRQALLINAGKATNSNLADIGNQLRLAKPIMQNPLSFRALQAAAETPAYGVLKSLFGNPSEAALIDPRDIEVLGQEGQNKSSPTPSLFSK